jgi:hypothetical protein
VDEEVGDRDGSADVVALGVVDAEAGDHPLRLLVGDELGDCFVAEAPGRCGRRRELVHTAADRVLDELAVDLDVVKGPLLGLLSPAAK